MLIAPRGRTSVTSKTSVEQCQDSIIMIVKDVTEIDEIQDNRAEELKNRGSSLTPMLIVVGDNWESIEHVYICINNNRWLMDNLINGFDTLFKSFYILETPFPKESSVLWGLIQKYVYKMELPQVDPGAAGILVDLKRISIANSVQQRETHQVAQQQQQQREIPVEQHQQREIQFEQQQQQGEIQVEQQQQQQNEIQQVEQQQQRKQKKKTNKLKLLK
ncbi:hypothetical protein HCN44_007779 [Aphidius gifuensis]|uniref:Uncharacterized protein n=1 Tax=Aphidius gifuensis TaxID=684658 RepID=A0A835CLH6_APHGI|nr:hypothetical protein HCN44_007779 [Aphidius gifuensis]